MNNTENANKRVWIGRTRFGVQAIAFAVTAATSFAVVRSMGLPTWAFMGSIILAGLFFCGWICPFGSAQEWLRYFGKRVFGISLTIPKRFDRYLLFSRYVLLLLGGVLVVAALDSRKTFMVSLAGTVAEVTALSILGVLLVLSIFVDRPYCRYLCKFGAMAGLFSIFRVFGIQRNVNACVNCGKCDEACMMGVEVSRANTVRDPNCINCGKCLSACAVPDALRVGFALPCLKDAKAVKEKYAPRADSGRNDDAEKESKKRAA